MRRLVAVHHPGAQTEDYCQRRQHRGDRRHARADQEPRPPLFRHAACPGTPRPQSVVIEYGKFGKNWGLAARNNRFDDSPRRPFISHCFQRERFLESLAVLVEFDAVSAALEVATPVAASAELCVPACLTITARTDCSRA